MVFFSQGQESFSCSEERSFLETSMEVRRDRTLRGGSRSMGERVSPWSGGQCEEAGLAMRKGWGGGCGEKALGWRGDHLLYFNMLALSTSRMCWSVSHSGHEDQFSRRA